MGDPRPLNPFPNSAFHPRPQGATAPARPYRFVKKLSTRDFPTSSQQQYQPSTTTPAFIHITEQSKFCHFGIPRDQHTYRRPNVSSAWRRHQLSWTTTQSPWRPTRARGLRTQRERNRLNQNDQRPTHHHEQYSQSKRLESHQMRRQYPRLTTWLRMD